MTEQLCPACGCVVTGSGHEKEGVVCCCEPCATKSGCECGCCTEVEKSKE
jgi:hypothetical protein